MSKKPKVFEELERLSLLVPAAFYWGDTNMVIRGVNKSGLKIVGNLSEQDLIGKSPYDLYSKTEADIITSNARKVLETRKTLTFEESLEDLTTGKIKYFNAVRAPLIENGEVVGIVGTTIDITAEKEAAELRLETERQKNQIKEQEKFKKIVDQAANDTKSPLAILLILAQQCGGFKKEQIFEKLSQYAPSIPIGIYWLDLDNKVVGANEQAVKDVGQNGIEYYIGKSPYNYFPHDMADNIVQHNNEVIRTRKVLANEEPIKDVTTGEIKYFMAFKVPLFDDEDKVIGVLGTSVDITREKRAVELQLETERQKAKIEEQERFEKIASEVAHDMEGQVGGLACAVVNAKSYLPEKLRIDFNTALTKLKHISAYLISIPKQKLLKKQGLEASQIETRMQVNEQKQPVILQLDLLQALSEKGYEYSSTIDFKHEFAANSELACIEALPSDIYRMLSNLLNNSIQALKDKKDAKIVIKLAIEDDQAKIIIKDNGKGMSEAVLKKLRNNIAVTDGKEEGHGIGMGQVRSALKNNNGTMEIESQVGKGTTTTLTFPIIPTPDWLVTEVIITKGDTIVVLDDDPTIHEVWDNKFEDYKQIVDVIHFTNGEEAIDFINSGKIDKERIILLTDYELVSQNLNGLDVVAQTKIPNTFLVTSHFDNLKIRQSIDKEKIKLLPKQMASGIVIKEIKTETKANKKSAKKAKVVILEDEAILADGLQGILVKGGKPADVYNNGKSLLENFAQYSKDTKFCLDYKVGSITGLEVAKVLHEAGYKKLYLLTGYDEDILRGMVDIPNYIIKVLSKTDIDKVITALS